MSAMKEIVCPCGKLLLQTSSTHVSGEKFCHACRKRVHFEVKGEEILVRREELPERPRPLLRDLKCLSPLDNSSLG